MLNTLFPWFKSSASGLVAAGEAALTPTSAPRRPMTVAERRRMAQRPPSFTDALPWTSFDAHDEVFVLEDGVSVAALFELTPTPTEAMPEDWLQERCEKVMAALKAIPEEDPGEWVLQFFVNDDPDLEGLSKQYTDYIRATHADNRERGETILASDFTQSWIQTLEAHLARVARPEGLFEDTAVSGNVWRGCVRRVRCVLYRKAEQAVAADGATAVEMIQSAAEGLVAGLREADVGVRRANGQDFYDWMQPFLNRPEGLKAHELREMAGYPGERSPQAPGQAPMVGFDLAEQLSLSEPHSDPQTGTWQFDEVFVKAMTLQQVTKHPAVGHFTAERIYAEKRFARLDRLPNASMLSITMVMKPNHLMRAHVERIQNNSLARSAEAEQTYSECKAVLDHLATGDKLVPVFMTLYVSGSSAQDLRQKISAVSAQLAPTGLRFIASRDDLTPLDAFMRGLPMCFDPQFDLRHLRRSRLMFLSQVAALLPVYGRCRGSGNPGMCFWNRGGEPLWLDPLNNRDRRKNAHLLALGPAGAGKSATLNYLCLNVMAIYRPRLVIVDAGESFGLLVQYLKGLGLSTHVVQLNAQADVSLPPFVLACKLLNDASVMDSYRAAERMGGAEHGEVDDTLVALPPVTEARAPGENTDPDADKDERRDILGEMLIAAILMITGGEAREVEKLGRADRYLVTRAIISAAQKAQADQKPHPLAHDVAVALLEMLKDEQLSPKRRERAEDMGQAMLAFTQGLRGKLFNRSGTAWPDVDVTLVEMGTLVKDGYEDALALAYTSLIDHVQATAEATQHDGRPMIFLTDEGHIITTNPLLGPKIAKGTKMWRKLKTWFWLATQNMKDFPDSMSRVLSMCEWWLLLTMDKSEVQEVVRFKTLTREQRLMMESCHKEPPKYTEGVILSARQPMLFRNVPPALAIALAMTEGHEKAQRRQIMDALGCSEMEAALEMARRIEQRDLLDTAGRRHA